MLNLNDPRLKQNQEKKAKKDQAEKEKAVKHTLVWFYVDVYTLILPSKSL